MRTSATLLCTEACHAVVCSCMAILFTPTVMALVVLNGQLRSLDVCCLRLWLLGLWHEAHLSVRGESAKRHPSLAAQALLKCHRLYAAVAPQPFT